MDFLKKFWPRAFKADDVATMIINIIIYLVVGAIAGLLIGILSNIPVVKLVTGIAGALVDIYCLVGIVLSVLKFCKVVK